ncbi:(-)-germacrene D synthase-like [Juglans microcarpa x Juglans regia]|uniref:(-)-germacrene D synthase-like n=1 Tax=Juglans microcarpa x Juglans regia TaxID=2249226 RepID=UPI001B7E559A|nr:(-)-germacrene D synthase-like [Juglans microcarpa x Juglans regia]
MSLTVSAISAQTQNSNSVVNRPVANFRPSLWRDHFLSIANNSMETYGNVEQVQKLKEEVQRMLMAPVDKPSQKLELIDAIQRLGASYHFESEIDSVLQEIHKREDELEISGHGLYTVALRFRLLRQQGYNIPSDVFNKFKDSKGNFRESLIDDVQGILCLYEASHMRVHGEDILDEALDFTTARLETLMVTADSNPSVAAQVSHALQRPLRKCLPRLEARHYLSIYQESSSFNEVLLNFAKLDFNILQGQHQKELVHISRWWKDLDVATKLSFARDRVVELYFWILGVYFEPQYALARRILTKIICMMSIIDDAFDAYGTLEELELFTNAVKRWDINCIDQLPQSMKLIYKALLDVYEEIEEEMSKEGRFYRVYYAKEEMKNQVQAYFVEAKWFNENYVPTFEEYMDNALGSSAYSALTTLSFVGMGDIVTKEAFDWVFSHPRMVKAAEIIGRLMNDIVSTDFEQQRGHVVSGIECYMKQHDMSKQEVHEEFHRLIVNAWKDMNEELLKPTQVPMPLLLRILNLARVLDLLYKNEDAYTHLGEVLIEGVTSLLVDPVLL